MHGSAVSHEGWHIDKQTDADREAREPWAYVQHGKEVGLRRLQADWVSGVTKEVGGP